jgi:hypothetical protein
MPTNQGMGWANDNFAFQAREHMRRVTEHWPNDVDAWVEYGMLLETDDCKAAYAAYSKVRGDCPLQRTEHNHPGVGAWGGISHSRPLACEGLEALLCQAV